MVSHLDVVFFLSSFSSRIFDLPSRSTPRPESSSSVSVASLTRWVSGCVKGFCSPGWSNQTVPNHTWAKAQPSHLLLLRPYRGKRNRRRWSCPAGPEGHEVSDLQVSLLPGCHQGAWCAQEGGATYLLLQRRWLQSMGSHYEVRRFKAGENLKKGS